MPAHHAQRRPVVVANARHSPLWLRFAPGPDAFRARCSVASEKLSGADAAAIEWETVWLRPDDRRGYGETRMIGIGYIGLRLYGVVFTDRGDDRRIISLRKAHAREVASYAET